MRCGSGSGWKGRCCRQQAEYWKKQLAGAPALLELPTDHPRPAQQDYAGALVGLVLDEELTAGSEGAEPASWHDAVHDAAGGMGGAAGRLSGQDDSGDRHAGGQPCRVEIEGLIGFFVNTLALRVDLSGVADGGASCWGGSRSSRLAAQQHQDMPFEQVVEIVQPVAACHSPLFQVMFAWQNAAEGIGASGAGSGAICSRDRTVGAKFDLTLSLQEAGERIVGRLEYATALFERATIERYLGYFKRLLEGMVGERSGRWWTSADLSEAERHQVVYGWNETEEEYPKEKCIHELFEEQVERTPEAVAAVFEEAAISYEELNRRANRLAHYLSELGVRPDDRVAICVERSFEMIVGLLGVLKAGGAYVPLDPAYPAERLQHMMIDSGAVVLVTQRAFERAVLVVRGDLRVLDVAEARSAVGRSSESRTRKEEWLGCGRSIWPM